MAPKVTQPESEADATAGPQSPAELLDLMRGGRLVFNGVRVLTLRVELADGTTQRLQLPAPARAKNWAKTRTGRAILDAMATENRPMKAATIAKLAGSEYSGSFRQTLKGLADQGEIVSGEDGYELSG